MVSKVKKYLNLIENSYKEGFIEDLKSGRHISAIISGYGATFLDDYNAFVEAFKQSSIFQYYDIEKNGNIGD